MITKTAQAERRAHRYSIDLEERDLLDIDQINVHPDGISNGMRVTFYMSSRNPETGKKTELLQEMVLSATQAKSLAMKLTRREV